MSNENNHKYTSSDTHRLARKFAAEGLSCSETAQILGCSASTVGNILAHYKEQGHDDDLPKPGCPKKLTEASLQCLNWDLRANPRQKLKDITENINSGLQPLG